LTLIDSLNLEKGILYTAKELTIRPGKTIRNYIEGKRVRYSNPVKYLLLISAIAAFINLYVPYEDILNIKVEGTTDEAKAVETTITQLFGLVYRQYFTVIMVASIPIISFLTWIFFFKHKVNFAENMVLNTYLSAQSLIIYIILNIPILLGLGQFLPEITVAYSFLMVLYVIVGFIAFFRPQRVILAFFKGVVVHLIYYVGVSILVGGIVFAIVYQKGVID